MLNTQQKNNLLVILGATAGGKTALAVRAARQLNAEIISADSRQVYRGMDIGTGKDLAEYGDIPYHLIDIADPGTEYNVFNFQRDCFTALAEISARRKSPCICGGTGMYLDSVLRGYRLIEVPENPKLRAELALLADETLRERLTRLKPQQHNSTDLDDRARLVRALEIALGELTAPEPPPLAEIKPLVFGVRWPREILRQRIALRLQQRFAEGMIAEVEQLHEAGVPWEKLEFYGLEYRLIAQYLQGQLGRDEMGEKLYNAICLFAKRQGNFFRRMEKQGVKIHWLDGQGDPFGEMTRVLDALHYS